MATRVAQIRTQAETALAAALAKRAQESSPLAPMRKKASELFAAQGLPHRRVEAWHYTDLRNLMRDAYPLAARPAPAKNLALEKRKVELECWRAFERQWIAISRSARNNRYVEIGRAHV